MADLEFVPPVLAHMRSMGYQVFTDGDWNLNIFGVRSKERIAGRFDDWIGAACKRYDQWYVRWWQATTDPSPFYLIEHPTNPKGTAILVPGQYRGAYKIGKHRGSYDALVQSEPVAVYRDDTKDRILDMDRKSIITGRYGINIHRSHPRRDMGDGWVGPYSAGCQVFSHPDGLGELLVLCHAQIKNRGWDTYTYTLLDQWW